MKLVKEAGSFLAFTSKDIYCKDKLQDNLERLRCYKITKVEEKGLAIFQMPMINVSFRLILHTTHTPTLT